MRLLLAFLMVLALAVAPFGGVAAASEPPPCHATDGKAPLEKAKACAAHCVLQASGLQPAPAASPSVLNAIPAVSVVANDPAPHRRAGPPDTPPPRV